MLKLNFNTLLGKKTFFKKFSFAIFMFLFSISVFANDNFYIKNYDINLKIDSKNRYDISEEITAEFKKPQRGIIRVIPSKYGKKNLNLSDIAVAGEPYAKKVFSTSTNLRIGDPNKFLTGDKTYYISYKYDIGDDGYTDYDEVYFNIIGNQWDTNIDNVNFVIELPKKFNSDKINFTTGSYGSKAKGNVVYEVKGNKIIGYTTKGLKAGEALTIALPLPQGYFDLESYNLLISTLNKILYSLLILLPILAVILWFKYGKNKQLVETVEFYPPNEMTPTEVGYYIDARVDARDITSLIIYWADKGYLEIFEETKGYIFSKADYMFQKKKEIISGNSYEPYLFNALFSFSYSDGKVYVSSLKDHFFDHITKTVRLFKIDLAMNKKNLYTKESIFISSLVSYFPFIIIIAAMIKFSLEERVKIFSAEILGTIPYILENYPVVIPISFFLFFISSKIKRRTEEYSELLGRVKGFRKFLLTAEKEKLEMLVDENPSYFYNILPYTIVLKVSDKWANKFDGILKEPPNWYHSPNMGVFSAMYFMGSLNRSLNHMNSNMYSTPGSNNGPGGSSMGGGSSGGGSGGGGGSSW